MTSVAYKVEEVPSPKSSLGEGPHWDVESQSLYYNDIIGKEFSILRHDVKENKTYGATIDGESYVSFIIPVAGTKDQFAVGIRRRVGVVQWDGISSKAKLVRVAFEVEQSDEFKDNVFNDAKADPTGRFYGGTMNAFTVTGKNAKVFEDVITNRASGGLYKYASNEKVVQLLKSVGISNGLTWNEKTNKFYFNDSCELNVKEFDYDPATGHLSNERVVIDFTVNGKHQQFLADGMTIDTQGNLYVAIFNGSKVFKINPTTGKIELEIKMPTQQITSLAFGGQNLDVLYVTSAHLNISEPLSEVAGHLFKVTGLGVKGFGGVKVRV